MQQLMVVVLVKVVVAVAPPNYIWKAEFPKTNYFIFSLFFHPFLKKKTLSFSFLPVWWNVPGIFSLTIKDHDYEGDSWWMLCMQHCRDSSQNATHFLSPTTIFLAINRKLWYFNEHNCWSKPFPSIFFTLSYLKKSKFYANVQLLIVLPFKLK